MNVKNVGELDKITAGDTCNIDKSDSSKFYTVKYTFSGKNSITSKQLNRIWMVNEVYIHDVVVGISQNSIMVTVEMTKNAHLNEKEIDIEIIRIVTRSGNSNKRKLED